MLLICELTACTLDWTLAVEPALNTTGMSLTSKVPFWEPEPLGTEHAQVPVEARGQISRQREHGRLGKGRNQEKCHHTGLPVHIPNWKGAASPYPQLERGCQSISPTGKGLPVHIPNWKGAASPYPQLERGCQSISPTGKGPENGDDTGPDIEPPDRGTPVLAGKGARNSG